MDHIILGFQWVIGIAVGVLFLLCAIRFIGNYLAPVKTVKAQVVDKSTWETFSRTSPKGKHVRYTVVFQAGKKKLSFYVSPLSYEGYRIRETGTLKYKGDRIIDFH